MDSDQAAGRQSGASRLSRLPRATAAAAISHSNDASMIPRLPQAASTVSVTIRSTQEEDVSGANPGARFGWHQRTNRISKPPGISGRKSSVSENVVIEHDSDHLGESLELHDDTSGRYNALQSTVETPGEQKKKKPRPSLSERTMETLSLVPPSPSPSKKKASITGSGSSISIPQSPNQSSILQSPGGQLTKPTTYASPRKISASLRNTQIESLDVPASASAVKAPYKSRIQNFGPNAASRAKISEKTVSTGSNNNLQPEGLHKVQRIRSLLDLKDTMHKQPTRRTSLNFKDISTNRKESRETTRNFAGDTSSASPIRTDRKPPQLRKKGSFLMSKATDTAPVVAKTALGSLGPKSSASLREAIAKAKAAKNKALTNGGTTEPHDPADERILNSLSDLESNNGIAAGSLKARIRTAVTSGSLNIAALGLPMVPLEVLSMYDTKDQGHQNWSEAVDLTKFIIADNEIENIPDDIFPDWSMEELQDDDSKSNIFGGLEMLDFHGNHISQLPKGLRRLERLRVLNISNNKLTFTALDVICQMTGLRELSLADNELEGVLPSAVRQLQQLHTLNLQNNQVTEISTAIADLESLRKLDVSNNLLGNLPMNALSNLSLIELKAAGNKLSGALFPANFSGLSTLQNLNVSNNNLSIIFEGSIEMPKLQTMVVDNNRLQGIGEVSGFQALVTLTASDNQLEDIPEGFVSLRSLRTVNFTSNSIKVLDPYISKMENLSIFKLDGNPLRDRKYLTMSTADLKSELAKRLTAVYVRDNQTETPPADLDSAAEPPGHGYKAEKGILDLSTSNFGDSDVDAIDLSTRVHMIDISHNRLITFPERLLNHEVIQENLKVLNLSFSKALSTPTYLNSIIFLPNLSKLSITNSGLASVEPLTTFLDAPQLVELNVSCNRLRGPVPNLRTQFGQLITLLASDNEFTSITPDAVRGLEVVDVRNNEIEFLPPKIGELGNVSDKRQPGRLRIFECGGNKFRVPRIGVVEKGTEAILKDLRRMVITDELGEEWRA